MKTLQLKQLVDLGIPNSRDYCDPVTGECNSNSEMEPEMTIKIDPVCKMDVNLENTQHTTDFEGEKYYFCSAGCQHDFEKNPTQYVKEIQIGTAGQTH